MKISLAWLNDYLDRPTTADEAGSLLTAIGFPIEDQLRLPGGDVILDVEVTSNRPDLLSHLGLARELAAASDRRPVLPDQILVDHPDSAQVHSLITVSNEAVDLCPLYTARVILGLTVGPSPNWLVERLEGIGLRSVNSVVDVTNFVLMELGQPLHAFDMNKLAEKRIVVRRPVEGEQLVAIDGSHHKLNSQMLVIADGQRTVAVAGVMGGIDTEVGDQTSDILLESAQFDPLSVRQTSRGLKLFSESSFRFERGIDPLGVETASARAARMIAELGGGKIASGIARAGQESSSARNVTMRPDRCRQIIGIDIDLEPMQAILNRLELRPQLSEDRTTITCTIPTHRLDLRREIDLIEEVARLYGYNRIGTQDRINIVASRVQPVVEAKQVLAQVLGAHGYHETVTFSTVSVVRGQPFVPDNASPVLIADERRKAEPMLRPSLLPSLLACRKKNQDVGNVSVRLYETAAAWWRQTDTVVEQDQLGMLCDIENTGQVLRDMRGTIEELIDRMVGDGSVVFDSTSHKCLNSAAAIIASKRLVSETKRTSVQIGVMGELGERWQETFELATPVAVSLLDLDLLLSAYPPQRRLEELNRFPGIGRDLSIVVAEQVTWRQIVQAIHQHQPDLLSGLLFQNVYRGKPIPKGCKSVTLRLNFRDPNTTLRHEQVDPYMLAILDQLRSVLGAELRE